MGEHSPPSMALPTAPHITPSFKTRAMGWGAPSFKTRAMGWGAPVLAIPSTTHTCSHHHHWCSTLQLPQLEIWSEIIKENTASFTIEDQSEHYLHLISYDNAGNISDENVYGPYQIDKILPKTEVTPPFSDWTNQPVAVHVTLSDEGGSRIQKYKYARTNEGITPNAWKEEVTDSPETIMIDAEGEQYLHIIAYDNAGNESLDNIFGKYKLDFTVPELIEEGKEQAQTRARARISSKTIKFTARDNLSGVKKLTVNGNEIMGTEYIVTRNGEYRFEILDHAGNILTKTIIIDSIYYQCEDDGLGHPSYSSSYNKCPVCDYVDGVQVINTVRTYGAKPEGVTYKNPRKAKIVEYYNNTLNKPLTAGQYDYELKTVYNGVTHNTGIAGTYTVKKKPINITGVKLKDKIYDGKTEVQIDETNVELQGIEEADQ